MPKNNPAVNVGLATPKVKGNYFRRDMDVLTTLPAYKFVPVGWIDLPGRTHVDMSPIINIDSLPAVSPLYDGWTLETYYLFVPHRLHMRTLRMNNVEDVGTFDDLKLPYLRMVGNGDAALDAGLNRYAATLLAGSVLHRLGFQPANMRTMQTYNNENVRSHPNRYTAFSDFNMLPYLAYLNCWLYGQFNKQDKNIPVEYTEIGFLPEEQGYRRDVIKYVDYDDLKQVINYFAFGAVPDWKNDDTMKLFADNENYYTSVFSYGDKDATGQGYMSGGDRYSEGEIATMLVPNYSLFDVQYRYAGIGEFAENLRNYVSNTGLLPVTYYGDYFTSWFNEESISKLQDYAVSVDDTMLSLRKKNSDFLIDMLSMVSGNDYRSYLKYIYGSELDLVDHPILVGKDTISFGFTEVLNQSANTDSLKTTDINQSLAYSASKARSKRNQVRDINFKTREPGLLLVCASLRSTCRYFEGQDAFLYKTEFSEIWHPQYSATGFMNPRRGEIYANLVGNVSLSADNWYMIFESRVNDDNLALPYVPVGYEYMTGKRTLSGAMVTDYYRTWSLARDYREHSYRYENTDTVFPQHVFSPSVENVSSTYGESGLFTYNFVDVSAGAQNFILDFTSKVSCFQPMKKVLVKPTI